MPHIGLRPFSKLTLAVSFSVKLQFLWPAPALDLQDIVQEPETAAPEGRLTLDPHPPGREREVHLLEIEVAALFIIGDAEPIEMGLRPPHELAFRLDPIEIDRLGLCHSDGITLHLCADTRPASPRRSNRFWSKRRRP